MRIRHTAAGITRSYDTQLGRYTVDEAIPCFRCGVCCRRWQPLIGRVEAEQLAAYLGLETATFLSQHTRPYPLAEDTYQLNERDGACTFLAGDGPRWRCVVHPARPQACRDWDASFGRKECLNGLRELGESVTPLTLYDNANDLAALVAHLRTIARPQLVGD